MEGGAGGLRPRGVPVHQHLAPLVAGEKRQLRQGQLRLGGHRLENPPVVVEQARQGGAVEEVGVVLDEAVEPGRRLGQIDRHLRLGGAAVDGHRLELEPRQVHGLAGRVEEDQHDLEERRPRHVAGRIEVFHQLLERHVLVAVGVEGDLALAPQQLPEGGIAREIGAQHQAVGEEADQPLDLGLAPVGDQRADGDVLLRRPVMEERLEGGHHDDEERRPLTLGEGLEVLPELFAEFQRKRGPGVGTHGRPWPVGGQLERRHGAELAAPVGELLLQDAARQPVPLPDGEVEVLDGQFRQRRGEARGESIVDGRQLAREDPHRPAVVGDVVHVVVEQVLPLAGPEELGAHERPQGQVERLAGVGHGQAESLVPGVRRVGHPRAGVDVGDLHVHHLGEHLGRLTFHGAEGGAERLMAAHHLAQGALHDLGVELAFDAESLRDVVLRALGLELVEEPEALLSERQRMGLGRPVLARDARGLGRRFLLPLLLQLLEQQSALLERQLRDALGDIGVGHFNLLRILGGPKPVPAFSLPALRAAVPAGRCPPSPGSSG